MWNMNQYPGLDQVSSVFHVKGCRTLKLTFEAQHPVALTSSSSFATKWKMKLKILPACYRLALCELCAGLKRISVMHRYLCRCVWILQCVGLNVSSCCSTAASLWITRVQLRICSLTPWLFLQHGEPDQGINQRHRQQRWKLLPGLWEWDTHTHRPVFTSSCSDLFFKLTFHLGNSKYRKSLSTWSFRVSLCHRVGGCGCGGASVKGGFRLCRKAQWFVWLCFRIKARCYWCGFTAPSGFVVTNINNVLLFVFRPKFNKNVPIKYFYT